MNHISRIMDLGSRNKGQKPCHRMFHYVRRGLASLRGRSGQMTIQMLVFATVGTTLIAGFAFWADANLRAAYRTLNKAVAFTISEAGIEYYRWHLAHSSGDYWDGKGSTSTGPYVHDYYDKDGAKLGGFELTITPPATGTTIVTVSSKGSVDADPSIEKIIKVRFGIPSFAQYALVQASDIYITSGTEVFGPLHANGGIHFDGIAHNLVTSAKDQYKDPEHSGGDEFGVHTHVLPVDPLPGNPVPDRPDVFMAGRQFPVAPVNFTGLTANLADLKSAAQSNGRYVTSSAAEGFHLVLKTDDSFDLYKVTEVKDPPNGCVAVKGEQDWGTWTIENEEFVANFPFPANGTIFVEDYAWVDGQIDGARLTIAAGRLPENPSNRMHIVVNHDVRYTRYDGTDMLGLVAQGYVMAGLESEDDLRIDAATVAQNDWVGRFYFRPPLGNQDRCGPYHARAIVTVYGMVASNDYYRFSYPEDGTGYQSIKLVYDPNLLFAPPPTFPLSGTAFEQISWEEVK